MKTIILLLSLLMPQLVAASSKYDLERALNNLDQTIEKRNVYLQSKEAQISKAKRELAMTEFNADRYIHYKRLYNLYKKYDGDSAINYAQRCYEIGIASHREDWKKEATLNAARIMISRSVIFMSCDMLNKCGPIDQFPKDIQDKLAIALLNYNKKVSARPTNMSNELRETTLMKTIILLLSLLMPQLVAASSKYDLERALNNLDQTIEKRNVYLQSKEAQISKAKRELAMTEFNADRYIHYKRLYNLYKKYDGDSAINYAQRCYEIGIASHREDWKKEATLNAARIMISRSVIFMSCDMLNKCGPIDQFPKDIQDKLAIALLNYNKKVSARPTNMSNELRETNEKLMEEMKLRDKNFMDTYYLCTNYIKMYGNLKKSILALLKTHSYKDAVNKVSSTDFEDTELREFYKKCHREVG